MQHLLSHLDDLDAWMTQRGYPAFRARQVRYWVFQRRASTFSDMTDLPKPLRQELGSQFKILASKLARRDSAADGTEKLLLELADGQRVECVLLRDGKRRTICVSSQVGCAMGCVFCASGLHGVERNLTAAEIIEQMLYLQRQLSPEARLSHVVMMGMGEPLANLPAVLTALNWASDSMGLGISPRRITISTVGLPAGIIRLADHGRPYHLAVSLHAPRDELRNRLVPVNARVGIQAILDAADRYFEISGRRVTYEYVLLANVNDSVDDAKQLAELLSGRCALLNVIPYNPVSGLPFDTPSSQALARFRQVIQQRGIALKIRQRKGDRINAACGQLRRSVETGESNASQSRPAVPKA